MQERLVKTRMPTPEAWSVKEKQVALGKYSCSSIASSCQRNQKILLKELYLLKKFKAI